MPFADLALIPPLLRAVQEEGYREPTPIQASAIPAVLAGRDLVGLAQTGTGKTAAFALPILQRLTSQSASGPGRPIRTLVVTPTRELASQVAESFRVYGRHLGFRTAVIFGGVSQRPQEEALKAGADLVVGTPGRLLDLLGQGFLKLGRLEIFVLDEADRMLDMGFLPDVRRLVAALPRVRQSLFFSATMPAEARRLADSLLRDPVRVAVAAPSATAEGIAESVYLVEKEAKVPLLVHLLADPGFDRVLVFTRTKHGASRVAQKLTRAGVEADAIHGDKSQGQRERALAGFKDGRVRVLVATDIAARGVDVEEISHVVNFDLPNVPETYVHRIGRTARAGAEGSAVSFCDRHERPFLADIERLIRRRVSVAPTPALKLVVPASAPAHGQAHPSGSPRQHQPAPHPGRPQRGSEAKAPHGYEPREPVRLTTAAADEPGWARFSYRSSSAPRPPQGRVRGRPKGRRRRR